MTSSPSTSSLPVSSTTKAQHSKSEAAVDQTLVQRFLGGDESAFVQIMDRYRAMIFTAALNLLHSHSDAEEITQDTFMRAYRGLAKFRGESSLATWLYRIAVNLARNRYWYLFRRRRHVTVSLDRPINEEQDGTLSDLIAADIHDPAQESACAEFSGLVTEGLEKLDERHREILTMRNALLLPYEEIAAALGINVGTVKSRIARARQNLRTFLAERCPEFADGSSADDYFLPSSSTRRLHLAAA